MKCHKHYEMDAVSQCTDCGKALCPSCSEKFTFPICDSCNLSRIKGDRGLLVKNSVIMAVFFVIGFSLSEEGFFMALLAGYFFAGVPWGWSTLNKITPSIFLSMPLVGWLIYFGIKFALSLMIGMFVTPFKIYQIIKELKQTKELEEYTRKQAV
ncbi:hypothetical protein [Cytobacillus firmus]|uniref:hypothetical protein n=1 Tax=Cytobacillus firmus TaxID=1399 RepID=UPI0030022EBA